MYSKAEVKELTEKLNDFRNAYYNGNESLITDEEYDRLFDLLKTMEEETGFVMANSPTQTVGFVVQSKLNKVEHDHPMLSLDKTKDVKDIIKFANGRKLIASLKMDGLTCSIHYDSKGNLVSAETRGNGIIGEDVTENVKQISNIPMHINNLGRPLTVDGEVIVDYDTFDKINNSIEVKYSHPRNLASGSIRQLDTKITKDRNLKFIPWRVIEGVSDNSYCERLFSIGFDFAFEVVPHCIVDDTADIEAIIDELKNIAVEKKYPIDGIVFAFDNISYGDSLSATSHHPKHSIAFKFYDDCYETKLTNVIWQVGRTGLVSPVAEFEPVDLDGAITTRATLHNVSIMKELKLGIGDTISIYRANAVIPKVKENLTKSNTYKFPTACPCCGGKLELKKDGVAEMLYCTNEDCSAKNLSKFTHFVDKGAMDIDGLSEATLEKFLDLGIIKTYADIYHLDKYENIIKTLDGFGEKSYNKLISSIEKSRNVELDKFLVAIGINNLGKSSAKTLSDFVGGDFNILIKKLSENVDLTVLNDFGKVLVDSIYNWFNNKYNKGLEVKLTDELTFIINEQIAEPTNNFCSGKTFVVTGAFNTMKRTELEQLITDMGGKLTGSVSKKTNYLLTNETNGTTKYNKAMELGVPVMSEEEFLEKIHELS